MQGIVVINKPAGFTSMDCCAIIRKISGEKKVGHTGTLDPNATGVLPVCIGKATRLIEYMDNAPKKYLAEFKLGCESDTEDIWGTVVEKSLNTAESLRFNDIKQALSSFVGDIMQVPPMYSAKKVNGQRLYDIARSGKTIERKAVPITIYSARLLEYSDLCGKLEIECSRGTYIRTVITDLAKSLKTSAVMTSLIRTSAAGYDISQSVDLDELRNNSEIISDKILPIESAISYMKRRDVNDDEMKLLINGNPDFIINDSELTAVFYNNKLLGITKDYKIKKVFNENI